MPSLEPSTTIENRIVTLRGHRVLLDFHLAELYGVPTERLNEQVRRNLPRFPADFMFQLNEDEEASLRSQFATLKLSRGRHRKYRSIAFTEQGIAMLSSVLHSDQAIEVNIEILRAFGARASWSTAGPGTSPRGPVGEAPGSSGRAFVASWPSGPGLPGPPQGRAPQARVS